MVRSEKKERWIVYTLAVLLCLVLASFWLMCNVYARYTTTASGSDSARVAKFEVTEVGNSSWSIPVSMQPGFTEKYQISVTNKSEVTIEYMIEAKSIYDNLPLKFRMLDKDEKEIPSNRAEIQAGDTSAHQYQLEISWPLTVNDAKNPDYAGKTDVVEITLKAVQKD